MKRRILSLILTICVMAGLVTALPYTAYAATSGQCGNNVYWSLDNDGTLTISGIGDMEDYDSYWDQPWNNNSVKTVVIDSGVTSIGKNSFSYTELTSAMISSSIIRIGDWAFNGCSKLTNITISNGVTSIGRAVFGYCKSLTNITIPDSVAYLDDSVFSGCKSLNSVNIGNGLMSIGSQIFFDCNSLENIYYSGSKEQWSSIFISSSNSEILNDLTFHYGVDSKMLINIGEYVQMGKYYNESILWRCIGIDKNGPLMLSDKIICLKPFDAAGYNLNSSHSRDSERSREGSSYWADSNIRSWLNSEESAGRIEWLCGNPPDKNHIWNGYNSYDQESGFLNNFSQDELNAIKEVNQKNIVSYPEYSNGIYSTGIEEPSNYTCNDFYLPNYAIAYGEYVSDKMFLLDTLQVQVIDNNSNILGNDYQYGKLTAQCLEKSDYKQYMEEGKTHSYWLRTPMGGYVCSFPFSGHLSYDGSIGVRPAFYLANDAIKINGDGTESNPYKVKGVDGTQGNTNSTSKGAPIITSAKINNSDIFTTALNVNKDSTSNYSVEGAVDANGCKDVHLYITQGSKSAIEIPLNACKDIQLGKVFSPGQPIYMTAIDKATGKSTSKRTKLSIVGNKMLEGALIGGDIKLFSDFNVNIPDEVPVLSGDFGLSLGSISTSVELDEDKFKVTLGTDFLEGKKGADGKWKKEDWEGFKSGFKSAKEAMLHNKNAYKYLKNIAPKGTKLEMKKGLGATGNVTGYLEGYIDEAGNKHISEGGIVVSAEIKYKYQGMTVVGVVPLYYEIGAGGEVTFVGGVKDLIPGNGLQGAFTGSITPAVFFEAGGGVGVPMVFTAGVSGKVKAELQIALNKIYQKLDITGSAAFKLTGPFGIPTYSKDFAKGTWHIYETGNKNTLLGKTVHLYSVEDVNNIYAAIDIDAPLDIAPHSDSTQNWVGDETRVQLMADYTNQDVRVLEENSYENIAPVFAKMDGKNVIAWITDNKNRADGDTTMLVYSVEENGKWSAPKAVYDDGFADYSPVMKDGYIVWQKATNNITENMTARDLGAVCEIYLAKWNGNGFDEPVRVTDNAIIDQIPTLAVNNGVPTVVWVQNSENDFTGLSGQNKIMSYTGGTTKTEITTNNAVTYLNCAYINGALNIAYETDADADFNTLNDRELYTVSGGRLTNNELIDTHPIYADFNGKTVLFYYSDGKIVYLENGSEKTVTDSAVTDQFTVVSNGNTTAVLWVAVNDGSAEIHGALYDNGEWSEDIQISDLGQRIKFPSAVMNENGSIFAAFNRTEKVSDGDDYYVDGQSALCTINIMPSYDLEIVSAYANEETETAYVTVKNSGELAIDEYNINIDYGTSKETQKISAPLKSGETAELEIKYSASKADNSKKIIVAAELIDGEEYNTTNNSATVAVCNADIAVENVAVDENETTVTADISNIGRTDAKNVVVSLRSGSADGSVVDSYTVDLAVNDKKKVEFTVNKNDMSFFDSAKQLYVTAECEQNEMSLGNNDGYVYIASPSGLADYENEILNYSEVDGKWIVNSIARNNTDKDVSCKIYAAVYNSDGTLKGCGIQDSTVVADNDTGVDITLNCEINTGDTVKTFMWSAGLQALAAVSKIIAE